MKPRSYDYVIVGAGSAGCTLANRLTEDKDVSVLVLEAGGWDRDMWIHLPLGWGRIFRQRRHDWMYETEPVGLGGRRVECARGKVVGGSSSINAMAYARGNRADYARWAAQGLPDWSYAHVLPYFRRQERWQGGADIYRGGDGPLVTEMSSYQDPLCDAYIHAARAAGLPVTDDYNGAQQDGFARIQVTVEHGRRCSGAVAYLHPALSRPNLTVKTKALATQLVFDGTRVVGLEYLQDGAKTFVGVESRSRLPTGLPAGWWYSARNRAGGFPSPPPIRVQPRGSSRSCSPQSGTGTASAREFACFARSRASRRCNHSSRPRLDLALPRLRTKRSMPTSARRR